MRLYHRTSERAARTILTSGFRDRTATYGTESEHTGVWLSDRDLAEHGAEAPVLLTVDLDLPESQISDWEWVQERQPYREFLIPAKVLNAQAQVQVCESSLERTGSPKSPRLGSGSR